MLEVHSLHHHDGPAPHMTLVHLSERAGKVLQRHLLHPRPHPVVGGERQSVPQVLPGAGRRAHQTPREHEWRSLGEVEPFRERRDVGRLSQHVLLEPAVPGDARELEPAAEEFIGPETLPADSTRGVERRRAHTRSACKMGDSLPGGLDRPRYLVPRYDRVAGERELSVAHHQITVAYAACVDPDQDLVRSGRRALAILHFDAPAGLPDDSCLHNPPPIVRPTLSWSANPPSTPGP